METIVEFQEEWMCSMIGLQFQKGPCVHDKELLRGASWRHVTSEEQTEGTALDVSGKAAMCSGKLVMDTVMMMQGGAGTIPGLLEDG